MGEYSDIYRQTKLKKTLEKSIKDIASEIKKLDDRLKLVQQDFKVAISSGANRNLQNRTYVSTVLKIAAAPMCFIPVVGPITGAGVAALASFIQKGFFNEEGLGSIITNISRVGLNHASGIYNDAPIQAIIGGGENNKGKPLNSYQAASAERFVFLYGNAIERSMRLADGLAIGKFKVAIDMSNKFDIELLVKNYQEFIQISVKKTVEKMNAEANKNLYLPLLFWKISDSLEVAGQGSLLLESLDLRETTSEYKDWVPVGIAKKLLSGRSIRGKIMNELSKTRGSKLKALAKKRFDGIGNYRNIFGIDQNSGEEETKSLDRMITPIYLEKLHLCAYRSRYSESLKSTTDTNFLTMIEHYESQSPGDKFFNELFYGGRHDRFKTVYDCVSSGGGFTKKSIHSHSQFRRRVIYSWYCFHKILKAHLGTYILSSLPTLGINLYLDRRVMFALIDAVTTAQWATTRAYEVIGSNNIKSHDLKTFEITIEQLLKLPYIGDYFDPENIIYNKLIAVGGNEINESIRIQLLNSYNNLLDQQTNLVDLNVENLMPRQTSNNIGLFDVNYVGVFIESIYLDLRTKLDDEQAFVLSSNIVEPQLRSFREAQAATVNYSKDFSSRYDKIQDIGTNAAAIKNKYLNLIYQGNVPQQLQPNIYTEFSNNLANTHMGALVSAQNPDQFNQLEFNRSITRTLKSIAKVIAKIRNNDIENLDNEVFKKLQLKQYLHDEIKARRMPYHDDDLSDDEYSDVG